MDKPGSRRNCPRDIGSDRKSSSPGRRSCQGGAAPGCTSLHFHSSGRLRQKHRPNTSGIFCQAWNSYTGSKSNRQWFVFHTVLAHFITTYSLHRRCLQEGLRQSGAALWTRLGRQCGWAQTHSGGPRLTVGRRTTASGLTGNIQNWSKMGVQT